MEGKSEESDSYLTPLLNDSSDPLRDSQFESPKSSRVWGHEKSYNYRSAPSFSAMTTSVEIMAQEDEAPCAEAQPGSAATCRICLEHKGDHGDELIAPCQCKGTQQFVHRSCLDHWRSVKEGFAFSHCTTCRAQFHLHINFLEGSCWRIIKFRMFVARDVLLGFLAVQMAISVLGGFSYLCDLDGTFRKYICHGWDHIFSNHPVFFYYCLGAMIFFALLGIFGLVLQCTSYSQNEPYGYRSNRPTSGQAESTYCCNGICIIDCPDSSTGSSDDFCAGVLIAAIVLVIIFALIGIFYGVFAATIFLQRSWQRHYHILTKRKLTEEYAVVDLHGHYTPPNLDPEHAERLRMLNLL